MFNFVKKTTLLPLMFFFVTTKKNDRNDQKKRQCYRPIHGNQKNDNSVTPYVLFY